MIKRLLPLALAAAVTVIPAAASAGEVSLNGEGIVRYEPDSARLQFSVTAEHPDAAKASEQVSDTMDEWRQAIAAYRNELDDYYDADLSVYTRMLPVREQGQDPKRVSVASQTVSFSINDLDLLNPLIGEANNIKVKSINEFN